MNNKIIITCLIFLVHLTLLKADLPSGYQGVSVLSHSELGYIYPFPEECEKILDLFAHYASNFTKCSIRHARPIRICEKCVEQYTLFNNKYQELLSTVVNGTSCKSLFISHDRLNIVLDYYDSISAVWEKGNCRACFNWSGNEIRLSNDTIHFIQLFNDTTDCIVNNLNPNQNNSDEVCEKCMQSYLKLDGFYISMSPDGIGLDSVCMDIVDSMNATRYIWSKNLNCCKLRRTPEVIFLCCTGIISFLPVLFYLAVRYCGPIRDLPNVLRQSRFKQSLISSVYSNDGTGTIN